MKKFGWILCSCILLVGCNNYQVERIASGVYTESDVQADQDSEEKIQSIDSEAYYRRDESLLNQTKQVSNELYKKYRDTYYYDQDSSGYRLDLEWELFEDYQFIPGESEWAEKLDEVFPGIQDFMKKIDGDTVNKNPQNIVINNAKIRIKPEHLYEDRGSRPGRSYNYSSYMSIENEPVVLVNEYFKQLAEVVPNDKFVVYTPYVMGETKLLRFSTPAFDNRSYITFRNDDNGTKESYYEEGAVGYQLFIADNEIQKIRVMFNKMNDEQIDKAYFTPLVEWCKNEWHMEEKELSEVNRLIDCVIEAQKGTDKGDLGDYEYSYTAKHNKNFRYQDINLKEYRETLVELVIEAK